MPELSTTTDPAPMAEPAATAPSGGGSLERLRAKWAEISTPATIATLALLTIAAFALRVAYLGSRDLWLDEAASAKFASFGWLHFAKVVVTSPVNMTVYFALLHIWTSVMGDSEFMLRLPSVLFATATVPLIYLLGLKLFDRRAGLVAAALIAVAVSSVDFAQEARAYTLVIMLATVSSIFFVDGIEDPSFANCAGYVISSVMCIYSHMFGILLLPAQWLSLIFFLPGWRTAWRLTLSAIVIGLIALPHFALALGGSVVHLAWMQKTSPQRVAEFVALMTGAGDNLRMAQYYLIACLVVAALILIFDRAHRAAIGFLLLGIFLPAAIIYVVSEYKPLFWPRYLLVSQPFFIALAGAAISRIKPWPLIVLPLVPIMVFCVKGDLLCYKRPQLEDWPAAVRYVSSNTKSDDVYMVFIPFGRQPIDYYRRRLLQGGNFPTEIYPDPKIDIPYADDLSVEDLFATPHQRIWVISTGGNIQPAPFHRAGKEPPELTSVLKQLRHSSYQLEDIKHFGSVRTYLFTQTPPDSSSQEQ